MGIKGTMTEKNLLKSFAGESQARNRYDFFAKAAKKEGFEKIASIFEETARQEKEHAKRFFKFLEGGPLEITAVFPAGKIGSTQENLLASAEGELEEHSILYPEFANTAEEEGFKDIALVWRNISVAEKFHEKRYRELLEEIKCGDMFCKNEKVVWRCLNCGFVHEGKEAPQKCPACDHPQAWFERLS
ncbi:rubrerythrin family protein [candidate division WOR-3 bacterium]|nr:rubrerythrin family protein [candidate division WOR-3 bacterium]